MGWDWTDQDLRPIALIRVKYKDRNGEPAHARWAGPEGRAGSGLMWEDPDGLVAGVHSWEARMVGGVRLTESLGPIDKAELAVGGLTFQIRAPSAPAESDNAVEKADVAKFRDDLNSGRWERAEVIMWLLDMDTETTVEVFRGRAPTGWTVMDDERFTMPAEALPFSLPDRVVPHTRLPSNVDDYTVTSFPTTIFNPPAVYFIHERDQGKAVGPIIGSPVGNESFGWVRAALFGYRSVLAPSGSYEYHLHLGPMFGVVAFDAAVEGDDGAMISISDLNSQINDYIKPYENTDPAMGPVGSNVVVKVPGSESPAAEWATEGRNFYVRCYGYGTGEINPSNLPHYQYSVSGAGELVPPSLLGAVDRYDELLEAMLESPEWGGSPGVLGTGAIGAFIADAPIGNDSFNHITMALEPEPTDDPVKLRAVLGGMTLGLGFDLCPRYDAPSGEVRLFPLFRRPRASTLSADWELSAVDLRRLTPPRSIKIAQDPDRAYANKTTTKGPTRPDPPVPGLPTDRTVTLQESVTRLFQSEIDAVGETVEKSVLIKHWQPRPTVLAATSQGFTQSGLRIAYDSAQRQPVIVSAGGLPMARVQLGDVIRWTLPGYPDQLGQVRSRDIDVGSGEVTLRSHHIVFFNLGTQQEGESD